MTIESAKKVADAFDALGEAETDEQRQQALKAFVAAEREHLGKLGVETAPSGTLARVVLPIVLLAVLIVLAVLGIGTANKTTQLINDTAALAEANSRVICGSANQTALAYRVRGQTPSGQVEPVDHFVARMQAQRFTLRQTAGLKCGQVEGLNGFPKRRRAALDEIREVLAQAEEPAARKPQEVASAPQITPQATTTSAEQPAPPPTVTTVQQPPTTVTGPQGPQGPAGEPGQDGGQGEPGTPPAEPTGPLDPITEPVCSLTGICL